MSDLNQCTFTGRLGADPEIKSFQNGGRVCNFRMAVSKTWKDKNSGERKEKTEWVSVAITNDGLIGVAERFLRKGSRVAISGEQQTRKWTDQQGNDRYSTETIIPPFGGSLVLLDGKPSGGSAMQNDREETHGQVGGGGYDDLSDDIPF